MGQFPLYDESGTFKEHMDFDESVFGEQVNTPLLRGAVAAYEANLRQGNASTKGRAEIKGTTAKPWRQKGLGRARAGTRKSPLWRGGGTIFGPKPRSFRQKFNRKARRAAIRTALLSKFLDREVLLIERLSFDAPATKRAAEILKNIGIKGKVLVSIEEQNEPLWKSLRNIQGVELRPAGELSALDLVRQKSVLLTLGALDSLKARYGEAEKGGKAS